MKTKAIVFSKVNSPELEEFEVPGIKPNEILVKIDYSGISIGTERSIITGERTSNGTFPLVPGYMASGTVLEAGSSVNKFKPGDKVCGAGNRIETEINSVWGAQSSLQVLQEANCCRIPKGVPMKHAAIFVLPGVGLNAASMAGITEQDTVLISGQGLIGNFFGQWCRARGAKVIAIEPDSIRADISRQYVTEHVLNPFDDNLAEQIAEISEGNVNVVAEATANKNLISNASRFLDMNQDSKMVFLSWYDGEISLNYANFHNNQVTAYFPTGSGNNASSQAVLQGFASGCLKADAMIKSVSPVEALDIYKKICAGDNSLLAITINWKE
ncbi:MAG: zinc-binding dehydrogenase [Candidatus Theseobacter exili]|nr:zinc-binding dehydrogenase [Candidatus Theseobacter exili]